MKAFKAFVKPSEAPQRIRKKNLSFFSPSGIGTGSVNTPLFGNDINLKKTLTSSNKMTNGVNFNQNTIGMSVDIN